MEKSYLSLKGFESLKVFRKLTFVWTKGFLEKWSVFKCKISYFAMSDVCFKTFKHNLLSFCANLWWIFTSCLTLFNFSSCKTSFSRSLNTFLLFFYFFFYFHFQSVSTQNIQLIFSFNFIIQPSTTFKAFFPKYSFKFNFSCVFHPPPPI